MHQELLSGCFEVRLVLDNLQDNVHSGGLVRRNDALAWIDDVVTWLQGHQTEGHLVLAHILNHQLGSEALVVGTWQKRAQKWGEIIK